MKNWQIVLIVLALIALPFIVFAIRWVLALTSRDNWQIPKQSDADDSVDDSSTFTP